MSTSFQLCRYAHVTVCTFSTKRLVFTGGKAVITSYMRLSASRLQLLITFLWRLFFCFVLTFIFLRILYCYRRNRQLRTWRALTKVVLPLLLNVPWVFFYCWLTFSLPVALLVTDVTPLLARDFCSSEIRDKRQNLVLNDGRSNGVYSKM